MKNPVTDLAGHLCWTRSGTVWATWRLTPLAWNRSLVEQEGVAKLHRMLLRALQGEALMLSSMIPMDPVDVVDKMLGDFDLSQAPGWIVEVEATMDRLAEMPLGRRAYWLSVPLANLGADRWKEPSRAVLRGLGDQVGLPPSRPADAVLAARVAQAAQVEALIPAPFAPQRVTPAEQIWLRNHAMRRGMVDLPIPQPGDTVEALLTSSAGMVEPIIDEGGRSDPEPPHRLDLLGQRFLKVSDAAGADQFDMPASYQVMLALAETPAGGLAFPGSEVLFDLDRTGIDVDWAIRLRVNSRAKVLARNRAAVRGLNEQFDQRAAEITTGLHDLGLALELLTEYDELFATDKLEVEIEHVVLLAIGVAEHAEGQSPAALRALVDDQAKALTQHLVNNAGMKFERMPAQQERIWWQMLPGAPRDEQILQAYRQFTGSKHFAKFVPFIGYRLGGESGPVLMVDKEMSRPHPVHIDLAGYPELDLSGSIQIVAELGAGKTVLQKTIMNLIVIRDQGQFFSIDKSEDGEWGRFAATFDSHVIVDPDQPQWSMDPMRVIGGADGCELALSFLVYLLGLDVQGPLGRVLTRVMTPRYLAERHLQGLSDVVAELARLGREDDAAAELHERLAGWCEKPLSRVMFDPALPPADITVDATVWRTHCFSQPNADQLLAEHLFRQLPPEKIFGRAYYRVLIGLGRRLCFADRSRVAALGLDEMYDAMTNPENVEDLEAFVRRGRRPKALIVAGGHDAGDGGSEVLTGLIPTRVVMRHRDKNLAARALQWAGRAPTDPTFAAELKRIQEDTSPLIGDQVPPQRRGECFVRDAFGNFGWAQVLPPSDPARRAAVFSTPPKSKARRA